MKLHLKNKFAYLLFLPLVGLTLTGCEKDDDDPIIETRIVEKDVPKYNATINFIEKVNGVEAQLNSSNKPYINKLEQAFNISRLRYLVSNVTFHKSDGSNFTMKDYHFVDISKSETSTYKPEIKVPAGEYEYISFTFGFDRNDNKSGIYPELNLANWAWPGKRSEEHTSELQSRPHLVCRLLLEKKKKTRAETKPSDCG